MDAQKAKETVVLAGKKLVETGLIARTWGNVSCRISDTQFVITPSGRAYEALTPEELVTVNIEDAGYEGDIKPSSEKGMHAEVYKNRSDIGFVIHTHQINASAVSPLKNDIPVTDPDSASVIGDKVLCAAYALPGTKKLKKKVARVLSGSTGKSFILSYHGALCIGTDYDEAFRVAFELEKVCSDFVNKRYLEISGRSDPPRADELRNFYVEHKAGTAGEHKPTCPLFNSERVGDRFKLFTGADEKTHFPAGENSFTEVTLAGSSVEAVEEKYRAQAMLHREIYRRDKNINAVIHTVSPDILAVSRAEKKTYPLLDDFAQLIGPNLVTVPDSDPRTITRKLRGRNAVMIKDNGALCYGSDKSDTEAMVMVMEKGCRAVIYTSLFGKVRPISPVECRLMRFVYQTRYAGKK